MKTYEVSDIIEKLRFSFVCDAIQQKVHQVGKQNFTREAFKENEVEMIKICFCKKSWEETSSNTILKY